MFNIYNMELVVLNHHSFFYVRSNKTETYTVWFYRPDGSRMKVIFCFANTWEKRITIVVIIVRYDNYGIQI